AYESILNGDYLRRGMEGEKPGEEMKQGYQYYKEEFKKSDDPIVKVINSVGEGIEKAAGNLEEKIREIFKL
ncbi:MAG: hypothetical protein PHT01_01125, partial [Spirochaetales bacterium]|nr:hypothetical protein [Spirochaetales bacterium]